MSKEKKAVTDNLGKIMREDTWRKAVLEAEGDVMRCCPTIPGGKNGNESVEKYAARCRSVQDDALAKLGYARKELKAAKDARFPVSNGKP